jgi:hypothetical protein
VAGGESVHRVGDRDQGEGRGAVADRGEIGGFLRIRAEEDRVPRRQQRIDVVMTAITCSASASTPREQRPAGRSRPPLAER